MDETKNNAEPRRFFSLKWKALLWFSLVLVGVNASLSVLSYFNHLEQFERQRDAAYHRYDEEIQGLLTLMADHLQQAGAMLPELEGMRRALVQGDPDTIHRVFEGHWRTLQLELGIETVRLYEPADRLLFRWEESPAAKADAVPQEKQWVRQVNETETPLTILHCEDVCVQHAVLPLLAGGGKRPTVVLSSSLIDVVLGFHQVTGIDMGIILRTRPGDRLAPLTKVLPAWSTQLGALTNIEDNLELLQHVSEETDLDAVIRAGFRVRLDRGSFEVRALPIRGLTAGNPGYWVLIEDVTEDLAQIQAATRESLLAGALGLVLSESLLLAILWAPMSRLQRASHTLPLLARSAFVQVRDTLASRRNRRGWADELDVLDDISIALSHQLERLENQVEDHTRSLEARMQDLTRERDFVTGLLDNAEVMILTQNKRGEILMFNCHSEALSGYTEEAIVGKRFTELLGQSGHLEDLGPPLAALANGQRDILRHESKLVCKNRERRNIAWVHSHLSPHTPEEPAILSVGVDFTERIKAEQRLAWLADHDPLTGLFNRRRFQLELEKILAKAGQTGRTGALLFFDLDQFKYINDTSGHNAGDTLLQRVASELARLTRSSDLVSRLGGDEFALILRNTDPQHCKKVAAKINARLSAIRFPVDGRTHRISASIGIALFPMHGTAVPDLLASADIAMYQAKDTGRGSYHLFSPDDHSKERLHEQVHWKNKIEAALLNDRFELHFQPIMHIADGSVCHYEALLRMRDGDGSLLPPGIFIDVAERNGLIRAVDHMVLGKALETLAQLVAEGNDIRFSVNLSGHTFSDPELLPHLQTLLAKSELDPKRLVFEITETAAVHDLAAACHLMQSIKALGCQFALDDFGVGFSSFHYLKQLPVDFVKIDGSFVRNLDHNHEDRLFVRALADVVQGLGKKSIAEFVENADILAYLLEYGVDYAQGFHIGRPAPVPAQYLCWTA